VFHFDHLGLSPREESRPPPAVHEVVRVLVDEEGREMVGGRFAARLAAQAHG
jgi:hypothetical protein